MACHACWTLFAGKCMRERQFDASNPAFVSVQRLRTLAWDLGCCSGRSTIVCWWLCLEEVRGAVLAMALQCYNLSMHECSKYIIPHAMRCRVTSPGSTGGVESTGMCSCDRKNGAGPRQGDVR